jgi:outer membrane protein
MRKLLVMFATAFIFFTANAQQKIGHVNSAEVLQAMPEFKQMQDALEKKKGEYTKVLEAMYKEYETKTRDIQENGSKMLESVLEVKYKEVQDLQQRIQDFEGKVQADLERYQGELMRPINDKYIKGLQAVAKENGYTYILDIAAGAVPYFPETEFDVTAALKTKIGATLTPAPKPAAGTGTTGTAPKPAGTTPR